MKTLKISLLSALIVAAPAMSDPPPTRSECVAALIGQTTSGNAAELYEDCLYHHAINLKQELENKGVTATPNDRESFKTACLAAKRSAWEDERALRSNDSGDSKAAMILRRTINELCRDFI